VRQYRDNTLLEDALIQVDAESRSVVVVTDEKTHEAIEKVINDLDKPRPQVLIKVVFIEVTLDNELDAGLEGNYTFKGNPASTVGSLFGMSSAVTSGSIGGFGTLSSDNWSATLHALSSCGKAKVLSRPSIMARNNQQAVIVVGQEVPIVTASQVTDTGSTINTIQYQDVGIILSVTPFIASNKTVEMIVAPEISELADQTVTVSSNVNAPVINKRSAETVVVTPNATTIVIGGLMQKKTSSTVQKIPLLGDIPLLGHAFRHTVKSDTKSELLIFLTPYIIDSDKTLNTVTVNEANRSDLAREAISPDEIKNNLDTLRLMPQLDPAPAVIVKGAATPPPTPQAMPAPRSTPKATPTPKPTPKAMPTPKATPKPKSKPSPTPTPTPVG
jgi:general secretion pathway protein D